MRRRVEWASAEDKARWIDGMAYTDARLPLTRAFAARVAKSLDPNDREGRARTLHRFVRDAITYVEDPTWEEISDSDTTLERGFGDCDDKARLFVALCRAIGMNARIRPIFDRDGYFYHVQCEVQWPGSESFSGAQPGGWILCELILRGCELGQSPSTVPQSSAGARVLE